MTTQRFWKKASSTIFVLTLLFSVGLSSAWAESDKAAVPQTTYVEVKPPFVVNFGGKSKKLKFAKVDVNIQVGSVADGDLLEKHFPLIRNAIVLLLSRQSAEDMGSSQGQEKIRTEALIAVKKAIKEETGREVAEDLFFTNFVVQQ